MHSFILEFENEKDLREVARKLWDGLGVTGEMGIKPVGGGRWRLEVISEKEVRDSTLEKLKGTRVGFEKPGPMADEEGKPKETPAGLE